MEIDEEIEIFLQEPSNVDSIKEKENVNGFRNKSEAEEAMTLLFNPRLKSSLMLTSIGRFLLLVAERVPVKTAAAAAAADAGINLSSAFRLKPPRS
ncbi:hypothetical protein G6F37_006383 [Rhizopus arrhizus]|nr:hypothetical protein G6F38_005968 [Rhizopus arrhizus]KAG1157788.1 hypothetical protein G6F37_006383 [Rhizopus arrhizus]